MRRTRRPRRGTGVGSAAAAGAPDWGASGAAHGGAATPSALGGAGAGAGGAAREVASDSLGGAASCTLISCVSLTWCKQLGADGSWDEGQRTKDEYGPPSFDFRRLRQR